MKKIWAFAGKCLFAAPFLVSGVGHLVSPNFFVRIMPPYLPFHRELVFLSGVSRCARPYLSVPPRPAEVCVWASYNFVVFALTPYFYFRRRYTNTQLNLHSTNRRNDALVILVVLGVEPAFELAVFNKNVFGLSSHQILLGVPLTFLIFFTGTVLPTMILIYSILLPRYLKLTGSPISAVLLGGLSYAAMHIVEGWSAFDSPRDVCH